MHTITIIISSVGSLWMLNNRTNPQFQICMNQAITCARVCVCVSDSHSENGTQVHCFLGDHLFYATHVIHKYWQELRTLEETFSEQLTAGKSLQSVTKSRCNHMTGSDSKYVLNTLVDSTCPITQHEPYSYCTHTHSH